MAFQQAQQRPQPPRQLSFPKAVIDHTAPASPLRKRHLEESQEWILFAPTQRADSQSQSSQAPRTATQPSELGSLETHVLSQPLGSSEAAGDATCLGTEADDDGAELDSLDDGLHAFHHQPFFPSAYHMDQSGGTLLPTHDGLGTFTSSAGLQEQLWQFERYNPHRRRHVRRRSSIQRRLDEVQEEDVHDLEEERTARIEKWRLEQSKAVLDEIERETRRRKRKMSRLTGVSSSAHAPALGMSDEPRVERYDSIIPEVLEAVKKEEQEPNESWWQCFTRRVIQDLIGLDETTLSVIFGEDLVNDPSPTPTQPSPIAAAVAEESQVAFKDTRQTWELKILDRIARELGILVNQLSEHEGAFSATSRSRDVGLGAQMPSLSLRESTAIRPSLRSQRRRLSNKGMPNATSDSLFEPTIPKTLPSGTEQTDTSLWGIEEEPVKPVLDAELRQEQEYWERNVDVKMIFSYLKRRFSSTNDEAEDPSSLNKDGLLPASWTTHTNVTTVSALGTSPESLRRAEVIRRQHPLVSRATDRAAAQSRRRESLLKRHHMTTLMQRRMGSSSCTSQSTKRSRHSLSGSSRHYWDLGGSVGSVGSRDGFSSSALGGWGEV